MTHGICIHAVKYERHTLTDWLACRPGLLLGKVPALWAGTKP